MMRAPMLIAALGGAVTIVLMAVITGPVLRHVEDGGSPWWLACLPLPILAAWAGIGVAAVVDNRQHRLPPDLKPDNDRQQRERQHYDEVRQALNTIGEVTALPTRQGNGTRMPINREAAADEARTKRYMDGQGDQ